MLLDRKTGGVKERIDAYDEVEPVMKEGVVPDGRGASEQLMVLILD
jgi:hypothetical protein